MTALRQSQEMSLHDKNLPSLSHSWDSVQLLNVINHWCCDLVLNLFENDLFIFDWNFNFYIQFSLSCLKYLAVVTKIILPVLREQLMIDWRMRQYPRVGTK